MIRDVKVVAIPATMTNIWGLPEFVMDDTRYVVVDAMMDKTHRLVVATWSSVPWPLYVDFIRDATCNISWRAAGTSADGLARMFAAATPQTLPALVNRFRAEQFGLKKVGPANIAYDVPTNTIHFFTASRGRHVRWCDGVVTVNFGEEGSHGFLLSLIWRFTDLPREALKFI